MFQNSRIPAGAAGGVPGPYPDTPSDPTPALAGPGFLFALHRTTIEPMLRAAFALIWAALLSSAQNTTNVPKGTPSRPAPSSAPKAALTTAEIAKIASPSVVVIQGKAGSGDMLGSGFIVSKDGKIVTNLHVIRDLKTARVQLANGDLFDTLSVLATDERRDLAVVQIPAFNLPALELGDSDAVAVGEPLVIVGSPLGLDATVTAGILSAVRDTGEGFKLLQTDAAVNHGNSGGPLLNSKGQAIGVVSSIIRSDSAQGLNFAAPINYVRGLLSNLHGPMTLEQMRSALNATKPAQGESEPSLRETLDWLKQKIPLGAVAWAEMTRDGVTEGVDHQSQAWSVDSCTIAVGDVDTVTIDAPPLPRDKVAITHRNTLPLSDLTRAFVSKGNNSHPQDTFLSGDQTAYNVWLITSSTFLQVMNSSDPHLAPQSDRVNQLYLSFSDLQLANRVKDAFTHAADLCRKKEAF